MSLKPHDVVKSLRWEGLEQEALTIEAFIDAVKRAIKIYDRSWAASVKEIDDLREMIRGSGE